MRNTNKKQIVIIFIIFAIFILGIIKLFLLRFEAGDVYPEYSSLRSDPLGTKAFYVSLKNILPDTVERNYYTLSTIHTEPPTAFFFLGTSETFISSLETPDIDAVNSIIQRGGRIVVAFFPSKNSSFPENNNPKRNNPKRKTPPLEKTNGKTSTVPITKKWGCHINYHSLNAQHVKANPVGPYALSHAFSDLSWHSTLYFSHVDNDWDIVYAVNGRPVIIEKIMGNGSIVLCADSYVFSNEALQKERRSEFLAWCVGKNKHVIFDEFHFGIQHHVGIAHLMRKYRLHALVIGMIIFGALFVWKNSTYFIPPFEEQQKLPVRRLSDSRDHTHGLITLIGRNFSSKTILRECVSQWEKSFITKHNPSQESIDKFNAIKKMIRNDSANKQADPVKTYQTVCQTLSKRKPL